MKLEKVDVRNQAKWYETRRNELLQLLERTTKLEIPQEFAEELAAARKKCLENYFEIVLVGEFQGGKSTTFDALCGGRDLSPRGLGGGGIKTSAAKISAQNISDGETKNGMEEWVEIDFKSKFDIQMSMFDILHTPLSEDRDFRRYLVSAGKVEDGEFESSMSTAVEFAELLDLDDPKQRQAVRRTLDDLWSRNNDLSLDDKDRLRIATLQERFYGTKEYRKLISRTVVGVYDFQKMVAFPRKWATRWSDGQNAAFTLEEATFVFIADTLLRIKSENLARLGCRITDCPGLFANACDTNVAKQAILKADAIWYLINGEKMIGGTDLNEIRELGREDNIIGSVNIRGHFATKMSLVLPETEARLRDYGFIFKVLPYQARLAFLANQGKRMVEKNPPLSDHEIACMRMDADNPDENATPETLWVDMINELGFATRIPELKDIETLSIERVEIVREKSLIDDIVMYLGQKIIPGKSENILVKNGSIRAVAALQEYEGQLKASEDAALKEEKIWRAEVVECKETLTNFVNESKRRIETSTLSLEKELLSEDLAADLAKYSVDNESFINNASLIFASAIVKQESDIVKYVLSLKGKELIDKIEKETKQPLSTTLGDSIIKTLHRFKDCNKGCVSKRWEAYTSRVKQLRETIEHLWKERISEQDYIRGMIIDLPKDDSLTESINKMQQLVLQSDTIKSLIIRSPAKLFLDMIWEAVKNLIFFLKNEEDRAEAKKIEAYKEKIKPDIRKVVQATEFQKKISQKFVAFFYDMQQNTIAKFNEEIEGLHARFERERVEPVQRNFNESEKKRREIAETSRKIRVEQIEPLRKEIQEFEKQVKAELARR